MGLSLERDVWRYSLTGFFSRMTNLSLDWGMVDESGEIPIAVEGRAYGVEFCSQIKNPRALWLAELYLVPLHAKLGNGVALVYARPRTCC